MGAHLTACVQEHILKQEIYKVHIQDEAYYQGGLTSSWRTRSKDLIFLIMGCFILELKVEVKV